jgi:DNA-binding transcriptional LysR family regulator
MSNPYVDSILIKEEPLVVVLHERHRLASRRKISLSSIIDEPVLLGNEIDWSAFRSIIFSQYAEEGASPHIVLEASSAAALMGLAAKGLGIAFYAGMPKLYQGGGLVFHILTPERKVPISLVWRKGSKLPLVRQVLKLAGLN